MKITGLQKMTLLDFPGRIACTVFLQGCNFRCLYCANKYPTIIYRLRIIQIRSVLFLRKAHPLCSGAGRWP